MKRIALLAVAVLLLWPQPAAAVLEVDTLTINRWLMPFNVDGRFAGGASWREPGYRYMFGSGLWLGAIAGGDTLTSLGYDANSGMTEFGPGDSLGGAGDPDVGVYRSDRQWPPPQSRFPRAPQTERSDQDIWTLFNDFRDSAHIPPGRPLQVQVYQTAFAWSHETVQDIVLVKHEFENQSRDTLRQVCVGIGMDYDIGNATDDAYDALYHEWVTGPGGESLYVDHIAIGYDSDNSEPPCDSTGALGIVVLRSPAPERVSAMKKLSIDYDPVTDAAQYLTLAGYDYRTGVRAPFDTTDVAPGDKRIVVAAGPFDLAPGQLDSFVVAIFATTDWPGPYGLGLLAQAAESIYVHGRPGVTEQASDLHAVQFAARPNPARGRVRFHIDRALVGANTVRVYSQTGGLVRVLEVPESGARRPSSISWDCRDARGRFVPAGVYFCRLDGKNSASARVTVLR